MRPIEKLVPDNRRAPEAIAAVSLGRPVVVVHGGVGMVTVPVRHQRAATFFFMAKRCRGPVSLALTGIQCERLALGEGGRGPRGEDVMGTVESARAGGATLTTTTLPPDRVRTVNVAADPASRPAHVSQPGNMTVWRARDGGLVERQGHAEAAVDLARAAGLLPAGILCPVLDEDLRPAGPRDLRRFCLHHGLPVVSIDELLVHRCQSELLVAYQPSIEQHIDGVRVLRIPEMQTNRVHLAVVKGTVTTADPVDVRLATERPHADEHLWLVGAVGRLAGLPDGVALWLDGGDPQEPDSAIRVQAVTQQLVELLERMTRARAVSRPLGAASDAVA